jgi:hypothetical protein
LPLVLGNQTGGLYCVQTYDATAKAWKLVVVDGSVVPTRQSTFLCDAQGNFKINGTDIGSIPSIVAQVNAAAAAATAAQVSATAAQTAATSASAAKIDAEDALADCILNASQASSSATTAIDRSNDASASAQLAHDWAEALEDVTLPSGGKSAMIWASLAAQVADESRDLDISDPVIASEILQAGFFGTEREVTVTTPITITLPRGLYTSGEKRTRWASYKLRAASGTVNVVGETSSTIVTPSLSFSNRNAFRVENTFSNSTFTTQKDFAFPAVTAGVCLLVVCSFHDSTASVPAVTIVNDASLVFTQVGTVVALAPGQSAPVFHVWQAPMTAFTAKTVHIEVNAGNGLHYMAVEYAVLSGWTSANGVIRRALSPNPNTAANNAIATLTGVAKGSQMIGVAYQATAATNSLFASFSSQITKIRQNTSVGITDVDVLDSNVLKNASSAFGAAGNPSLGDVALQANFTGSGKVGCCLIEIPGTVTSAVAVVVNCEGGRTNLTVPYGTMEIWARPDGNTYDVKTSKP